jgi:hypothetical protein
MIVRVQYYRLCYPVLSKRIAANISAVRRLITYYCAFIDILLIVVKIVYYLLSKSKSCCMCILYI